MAHAPGRADPGRQLFFRFDAKRASAFRFDLIFSSRYARCQTPTEMDNRIYRHRRSGSRVSSGADRAAVSCPCMPSIARACAGQRQPSARTRKRTKAADNVEFALADVADVASLDTALAGADTIVNAVQFDAYPIENPRRGLTFERIDDGGTVALLEAAKRAQVRYFIYISGAAADENSPQAGFRAKGRAERAIRQSGLTFTIFRPSLVYGPEDKVVNMLATAVRFAPAMPVPGTGQQKLRPVLVDDVAACVALAISGQGANGTFEVGGPDLMTFDDLVRLVMDLTGHRRPIIHIPEGLLRFAGDVAEMLPGALFSLFCVTRGLVLSVADNACDIGPLIAEFGIKLTTFYPRGAGLSGRQIITPPLDCSRISPAAALMPELENLRVQNLGENLQ